MIRAAPKNYCKVCMELYQPWLAYLKERIRGKFHNTFGFVAGNRKDKMTFLCVKSLNLGYSKIPREVFNFPLQSQFHSPNSELLDKHLCIPLLLGSMHFQSLFLSLFLPLISYFIFFFLSSFPVYQFIYFKRRITNTLHMSCRRCG